MSRVKESETIGKLRRTPAITPEERENQLISLSVDLAEKKLRDGTAPSQVIVHYLKLGSTREQLEKEKLRKENEVLRAKAEAYASSKRIEELYAKAIKAMGTYRGDEPNEDDYEYED